MALGVGLLIQSSPANGQSEKLTPTSGEPDEVKADGDVDGFRQFTDTKGRTVEARLLSVMNGEAKIELRKDRRVLSWSIANFSKADIDYMRQWVDENISYRFVVRHRIVPNAPRNPVGGENRRLAFSNRPATSSGSPGSVMTNGMMVPTNSSRSSGLMTDDDDSEVQYFTLSIVNGSSAQLDDLEVKAWIVLNNHETFRDGKDSKHFVSLAATRSIPKVAQTETLNLAGSFPVKKIRKKTLEYTTYKSTDGAGFASTKTVTKLKSTGTIRESVVGVLVQIYHEGKLVDEYSDYDSYLKESGFNPAR